jgi:hypothetical protein
VEKAEPRQTRRDLGATGSRHPETRHTPNESSGAVADGADDDYSIFGTSSRPPPCSWIPPVTRPVASLTNVIFASTTFQWNSVSESGKISKRGWPVS